MLLTFYRFINNSGVDFIMIVDIKKLSVDYSGIKALDDISFGIAKGDFLGIIGPNGAGKSTLFKCMLGLHTQYDGTIKVFGNDIRDSRKYLSQIGYVPQKPVVDRNFPATIIWRNSGLPPVSGLNSNPSLPGPLHHLKN